MQWARTDVTGRLRADRRTGQPGAEAPECRLTATVGKVRESESEWSAGS